MLCLFSYVKYKHVTKLHVIVSALSTSPTRSRLTRKCHYNYFSRCTLQYNNFYLSIRYMQTLSKHAFFMDTTYTLFT